MMAEAGSPVERTTSFYRLQGPRPSDVGAPAFAPLRDARPLPDSALRSIRPHSVASPLRPLLLTETPQRDRRCSASRSNSRRLRPHKS